MSTSTSSSKPKGPPPLRMNATPAEQQAYALSKLLQDPSKPVFIPPPPSEGVRQLREPKDMMQNVQGSSAGAGSGEFHVYKQSRRREYERLKIMDEEEAYEKGVADANARQIEYANTADARTAKNRLKRDRKKAGRGKAKASAGGGKDEGGERESLDAQSGGGQDKKRKMAGGFVMKFKSAEEREEEDEEVVHRVVEREEVSEVVAEEIKAAKEAGIVIQDDEWNE